MCGRFTLRTPANEITEFFNLSNISQLPLRYNIAPTQNIAAIRVNDEQRELALLRWGLIPFWAKDTKAGYRTINARGETVAEKPTFRSAFKRRRCLIVADGFYEWMKTNDKQKQPYYIHMKDDQPFAFAGLWERWDKSEEIESCTIITTNANELMEPIHDRMPVILSPDDYDMWLDPEFEGKEKLKELLVPCPTAEMEAYPIATTVNNPKNDVAVCIERIAE